MSLLKMPAAGNLLGFARRVVSGTLLSLIFLGCSHPGRNANTSYIYPPFTSHWGFAQFGSFDLRLFLSNKTRFDNPQGVAVIKLNESDWPVCFWVNSGQNAIVYNSSVYSLGLHGLLTPWSLQILRKDLNGQTILKIPWGITVDNSGNVYVVDRGNSRVVKLVYTDGEHENGALKLSDYIGSFGSEPGQFLDPRGVAWVAPGLIAVVDNSLNRVTILNDSGQVIRYWEGLNEPISIASSTGSREFAEYDTTTNFLAVVDSLDRRITIFDLNGTIIAQTDAMKWNAPMTPDLSFVAIDRFGQVLITDRNNGCIHKLDRYLAFLTSFGESGGGNYQFDQPRGIAIDSESGKVYVVERERVQMLFVAVDVSQFEVKVVADSSWRDLSIDFQTTEPALVDLDLTNEYGQFVARIIEGRLYPAGGNHLSWGMTIPESLPDGRPLPALPPPCKPGEKLPDGKYLLKGTFRATYGSKDVYSKEMRAEFGLKR